MKKMKKINFKFKFENLELVKGCPTEGTNDPVDNEDVDYYDYYYDGTDCQDYDDDDTENAYDAGISDNPHESQNGPDIEGDDPSNTNWY